MNLKVGKTRWAIILLMTIGCTIWYMDRSNISIAGPELIKYFNWNPAQFGMVQTAFFIGYAITQMPGGWLADRFGGSKVMMTGTTWWSIFVFLTPFGSSLGLMMLIRAFMGLGEGVNAPANASVVAKWVPKKETGLAQGVFLLGSPIGIGITMPIAVWIIQNWGWRMVFYSFAFLGVIWCFFWWKFGSDNPEKHRKISQEELDYIKADQDAADASARHSTDWRALFLHKSLWSASVAYFCTNYLFYLFMTWLPTYFVMGRGFTLVKSGWFSMVPYMVALFTYPLGGLLADLATKKFGPNIGRKMFPIIGLSSACILLTLGARASGEAAALLCISASNGFLTLTYGGYWSMPMVFSPQNSGLIIGLFNTFGTIAGICAPLITGFIVNYTQKFEYAFYLGALIGLAGALILLTACRVKPVEMKGVDAQL